MGEAVRGVIRGYDAASHTATVEIEGAQMVHVAGVPVNRGIGAGEIVAGHWCIVVKIDDFAPAGWMVVAIY